MKTYNFMDLDEDSRWSLDPEWLSLPKHAVKPFPEAEAHQAFLLERARPDLLVTIISGDCMFEVKNGTLGEDLNMRSMDDFLAHPKMSHFIAQPERLWNRPDITDSDLREAIIK
ncbi:MAG: hypothetical protein V3R57_09875 [Candidatus Bathyarchaeia archaeon]